LKNQGYTLRGKYSEALITIDNVEESCIRQIHTFLSHPAFTNHVAIMPDTHAGKGAVIGFTMKMADKVVPNVVGVDIGCGMLSYKAGKLFDNINFEDFDKMVRMEIPAGMKIHDKAPFDFERDFPWHKMNKKFTNFAMRHRDIFSSEAPIPTCNMEWLDKKIGEIGIERLRAYNSIGTLGGGNHFIEVGKDLAGDYWITIHSGSRNLGKQICEHHQKKAQKLEKLRKVDKSPKGLEYLEGEDAAEYLYDMMFAQEYASANRITMLKLILDILEIENIERENILESVHNFIDFEDWIIRKGAIRSYRNEKMIIPFNMRDGILLCEGKSNSEWNNSAPHGAGRVMSRHHAKKVVTLEDFEHSMEGIFSTSVCRGTLDESPFAYKDASLIEEAIEPTAEILSRIKPVYNMKDKADESINFSKLREEKRVLKKGRKKKDRSNFKNAAKKAMDDYLKN